MAQAYHDALVQPIFNAQIGQLIALKAVAPAPLVAAAIVAFDLSLVSGFVVFTAGPAIPIAFAAFLLARRSCAAK